MLVSAGVGVTPMLAMLHALHDRRSTRDIWWFHGARNRSEHAFAEEAAVAPGRPRARAPSHLVQPARRRRTAPARTTTRSGASPRRHSKRPAFRSTASTTCADRPRSWTRCATGLAALGVAAGRVHTEIFGAAGVAHARSRRGSDAAAASTRRRTGLGTAHLVRADRARRALGRRATPASSSWRRPATCRCDGRVAPASATPARPVSSTEPSSTSPSRSRHPPTATCSCAAREARHRSLDRPVIDGSVDDLGRVPQHVVHGSGRHADRARRHRRRARSRASTNHARSNRHETV